MRPMIDIFLPSAPAKQSHPIYVFWYNKDRYPELAARIPVKLLDSKPDDLVHWAYGCTNARCSKAMVLCSTLFVAFVSFCYDDQLRRDLGVNGGRFGMRHNVEGFIEAWDGLFAAVCNSATNQKGTGQAAPFNGANNRGI